MDLMEKKRLREKKKAKEQEKEEAKEEIFKKPQKPYTPSTKKLTIAASILFIAVILYIVFTSESMLQTDCGLMPGLECRNVRVDNGAISFETHNFLKEDLNITLQLESCEGKIEHTIRPNEKAEYSFNCTIKNKVIRKKIFMTYVGYSGLPHDTEGYMTVRTG